MGCLSVYKYIRTSNSLPTVSSRSANSCSNSGCQRLLLGERVTRLAEQDARGCSKANSNNRMPRKHFLWTSATLAMNTNSGNFPGEPEQSCHCGCSKIWKQHVDLKSIAEMSHCVFKASPATFSRVDVTVGRRRKDSVRFKIIFPPQTLRPCSRVCLFVRHSRTALLLGSARNENKMKNRHSLQPN